MFRTSNSSDIYAVYNPANMPPPGGKKPKSRRAAPTAADIAGARKGTLTAGGPSGSSKSAGSYAYKPSAAAGSPGTAADGSLIPTGSSAPDAGVPVTSTGSWQKPALVVGGIVVVLGGLYLFTRKSGKQSRVAALPMSPQAPVQAARPAPVLPAELMDHPTAAEHMDYSAG